MPLPKTTKKARLVKRAVTAGHGQEVTRREADMRIQELDIRLHVVENKVENVASVLVGQREAMDRLIYATQTNGKDISVLQGMITNIENSVVRAIAEHAESEAKQRANSTRTAFWTLLTVVLTLGVTLAMHMIEKLTLAHQSGAF